MILHIKADRFLTFVKRPLVHPTHCIMDIAVEKHAVIRIIHDLTNGRAGTFRHHAVHDTFTFGHPGSGKTHV